MVESLRRYGGIFSNCPIIAVTPRFGLPLSRCTLNSFKKFDVIHLRSHSKSSYTWFNFLNKPLALVTAENCITTSSIAWMDSDLLILSEPEELILSPNEDFLGFPVEFKEMGTSGLGDPYEPLWQEFCSIVGINIDDLPWIITAETRQKVRLYFNGGIFVYRRSTEFANHYLNTCLKLLDSKVILDAEDYGLGVNEMSSIGLALVKLSISWRSLTYSHDYVMSSETHDMWYKEESLSMAKIIHYHDSMWPVFWPTLLECLQNTHPEVKLWLESLGPMCNSSPLQYRLLNRLLKESRKLKEKTYLKRCVVV